MLLRLLATLAGLALATAATAQINQVGVAASAVAGGCVDTDQTGLISAPSAHGLASCTTSGSALAEGTADLPTATAALNLAAVPPGANAAGETQLLDQFLFHDPGGVLAPGENLVVGVTFTLDASVSAGASPAPPYTDFLLYNLSLGDFYYGADPAALFLVSGALSTPTSGPTHFAGTIEVHQPFLTAQLAMTLLGQGLQEGTVDSLASVALDLPPGITWTSTSGVLLTVPEASPAAAALGAALTLAALLRTRTRSC